MSDVVAPTPNDISSTARPVSPAGGGAASGIMGQVRGFMGQPAVARALPAVGFVALIGLAALLWMVFSQAPGRTLFAGLPDADKAAVVQALETAGIAHTIDNSTGSIQVSEDNYHQARMLLAGQGLPRSAPDGTETLNNLPIGSSRAVEGERIRASRQADLARTIEAIDAVQSARVHIADNGQSAFIRDRSTPAASVMLTLQPGRTLTEGQVQAIVNLVASSIPGMTPEGVAVVDQNGRLLSARNGGTAGGATSEAERQISVQSMIEDRYRQAITALLTPIVGAGNFTTEVNADMDFSQTEASREAYPDANRTVRQEQTSVQTETGTATNTPGGIPGAMSNTPPPAATTAAPNAQTNNGPGAANMPGAPGAPAAGTQETRRNEQTNRAYAVGREISVTRNQTGTVRRLSVAVAVRNPEGGRAPTRDEMQQLENLIRGAVGFNQQRGDNVAVTARSFASEETTEPAFWEQAWFMPLARSGAAILIAALVVFGFGRPLLKRLGANSKARAEEAQQKAETDLISAEIATAIADQAIAEPTTKITIDMIEAAPNYEARAELIRAFVRQDPARAALVVRDLIKADTQGAAANG